MWNGIFEFSIIGKKLLILNKYFEPLIWTLKINNHIFFRWEIRINWLINYLSFKKTTHVIWYSLKIFYFNFTNKHSAMHKDVSVCIAVELRMVYSHHI